jgi:uncharacterized protein YdeI (YjbR/CyaY-like superfamily)
LTKPRPAKQDLPILAFTTVRAMEKHMSDEPQTSKGFWLKLAKAGAPKPTISKDEAIEASLCCGWIDGQLGSFDAHYFLVRMTPRRPGSRWSAKNRDTAERLAKQGRVGPAGQAEIGAAKRDGRWDAAYLSQGKAELPEDMAAALAASKAAKTFFETVDRANRYAVIYRVNDAKRPQTRARRIAEFVEMLARGETLHPLKASRRTSVKPKS